MIHQKTESREFITTRHFCCFPSYTILKLISQRDQPLHRAVFQFKWRGIDHQLLPVQGIEVGKRIEIVGTTLVHQRNIEEEVAVKPVPQSAGEVPGILHTVDGVRSGDGGIATFTEPGIVRILHPGIAETAGELLGKAIFHTGSQCRCRAEIHRYVFVVDCIPVPSS